MQKTKPRRPVLALILATTATIATAQQAKIPPHAALETRPATPHTRTGAIIEYAIPATLIACGALSLKGGAIEKLDLKTRARIIENNRVIDNAADNILALAPAAAAFIMKAAGLESEDTATDMAAIYAISNIAQAGLVFGAKNLAKRERPDASDRNSFPSAHTAIAFTAAEFLRHEYGRKSPWIGIGGHALAAAVGASRILNDKHWVSDVAAGAGVGLLCSKLTRLLYPKVKYNPAARKKTKPQTLLIPDYADGAINLKLVHTF